MSPEISWLWNHSERTISNILRLKWIKLMSKTQQNAAWWTLATKIFCQFKRFRNNGQIYVVETGWVKIYLAIYDDVTGINLNLKFNNAIMSVFTKKNPVIAKLKRNLERDAYLVPFDTLQKASIFVQVASNETHAFFMVMMVLKNRCLQPK